MTLWLYREPSRVKVANARQLVRDRECWQCHGRLLRLALRVPLDPYPWVPCGYICEQCEFVYVGSLV